MIKPKSVDEIILDPFEQEIEDEAELYVPVSPEELADIRKILRASREAREKEKRQYQISLSTSEDNVLHHKAEAAGMPSQTFLADIVRRYLSGQLTASQR